MQIPQRFVQNDFCVCVKRLRLSGCLRSNSLWYVMILEHFEHFRWKEADVVPWPSAQFHRHWHTWKMQACKHQKILVSMHTKTKLVNSQRVFLQSEVLYILFWIVIAAKLAVNFSSFARHVTTNVAWRNFRDLELSQQQQIVWYCMVCFLIDFFV